jgi:hypothetical protein
MICPLCASFSSKLPSEAARLLRLHRGQMEYRLKKQQRGSNRKDPLGGNTA